MDTQSVSSDGSKTGGGKNNQSIKSLQSELKDKEELLLDVKALIYDYQEKIKDSVSNEEELNILLQRIEEKKKIEEKKRRLKEKIEEQRKLRIKKQEENEKLKKELEEARKQLEEVKVSYEDLRSKDDDYNDIEETTANSVQSHDI
mmetsp:Transcript_30612/g.27098  ORF Transcript_30612/g.27098 Transcript_30612/m.27098 type:complete len:146 (-) Transcript_30612:92-529(-)